MVYTLGVDEKDRLIFLLMTRFLNVVKKAVELDKTPRTYGTGEFFHKAEIHMLEMIGSEKSVCVTGLAKLLNITKGAVSQAIAKLDNKGLITKEQDLKNKSRVIIKLSQKGYEAHKAHLAWHKEVDKGFRDSLLELDLEKLSFLNEFLMKFEDFLSVT